MGWKQREADMGWKQREVDTGWKQRGGLSTNGVILGELFNFPES